MGILLIAIFGIELLTAILLQLAKFRLPKNAKNDRIKGISFIIPFHNEVDRILPLIESINNSEFNGNCAFIFVDDYSTDDTEQLLKNQLKVPYKCVKNGYKRGKKRAIESGVYAAEHEFIVTWDADINFEQDYIQNLFNLPSSDLIILPVQMTSSTLAGKLACVEFTFIETFNQGLAGFHKPIACNGANLGFRKSVFLEMNKSRADYNIPSGDDMFLMWEMQKNSATIALYNNQNLTVSTPAPATFLAVIRQRQRWKGKVKSPMNFGIVFPLMLQLLVIAASVATILLAVHQPLFYLFFLVKFVAELIASWLFIKQHFFHILVLLIHQIWYPIYAIALIGLPLGKEKRWL